MKIKNFLLLLLFSGLTPQAVHGKSVLYALEQRHVNPNNPEEIVARVYNSQTGQTIWRKHFAALNRVAWSKDHSALAMSVFPSTSKTQWPAEPGNRYANTASPQRMELWIWRAGTAGVQVYRKWLYRPDWNAYDGVLDMKWSAHNRRLALQLWGSGGWDLNSGEVWCLEPKTGRLRYVTDGIKAMWWNSDRWLCYRKQRKGSSGFPGYGGISRRVFHWAWR